MVTRRVPRRALRRLAFLASATCALTLLPATAASAHPLGNFTVNQYHGLRLYPDRIEDLAVVDSAEIPTVQDRGAADRDGDGTVSRPEAAAAAAAQCADVAAGTRLRVGEAAPVWTVSSSELVFSAGAAGLETTRLTCRLTASARLTGAARVQFAAGYRADRLGWREISAAGVGVRIVNPPVPATSVSDGLRAYPDDLLSDPLDQRSVELDAVPGGPGGAAGEAGAAGAGTAGRDGDAAVTLPSAGPFTRVLARLDAELNGLVGTGRPTLPLGLLAVGLSVLLGAAHAALPGHGKTVMAAYLAGRRGGVRDAVTVGATVTLTHTGGVLLVGLLVTASASLAAESVLAYLGLASGLLIAGIGAGLLVSAWRGRRRGGGVEWAGGHHSHGHSHSHGHGHEHGPAGHHGPAGRRHPTPPGLTRGGLVGMGVAGGLVPSPSALIVLLGAVALGRTGFGVALVLGYGAGMAATLTAAGLLLVRLRDRMDRRARRSGRRSALARLSQATPVVTAGLVLVVGMGLAARGLAPLV